MTFPAIPPEKAYPMGYMTRRETKAWYSWARHPTPQILPWIVSRNGGVRKDKCNIQAAIAF